MIGTEAARRVEVACPPLDSLSDAGNVPDSGMSGTKVVPKIMQKGIDNEVSICYIESGG